MNTHTQSLLLLLGSILLAVWFSPGAHAAEPPTMVQPESLAQGFILVVDDPTRGASTDSPIHIASNHNGWNPADPKQVLTRRSDMRWQIVLPKPQLDSKLAFKFARSSWDLVETTADFKDIDNRLLPLVDASKLAPGEPPVIELIIAGWRDKGPRETAPLALNRYRTIKVADGTIRKVEVVGGGPDPSMVRDLLVWLPPGYDEQPNAAKTYAVLYMHDGQNLFEQLPGVPGEWKMDETAGRLIREGKIEPLIIVGIPHAGAGRSSEYLPIEVLDGVKPRGHEYIAFLCEQIMPRVQRSFRVRSGPESTGIGGASLGAVIALEAAALHPELFGKVLAESTPLLAKDRALFNHLSQNKAWPAKLYFGMGAKEAGSDPSAAPLNEQYAGSARAFGELVKGKAPATALKLVIDPEGEHNEPAWAARLPAALEFLFPPAK